MRNFWQFLLWIVATAILNAGCTMLPGLNLSEKDVKGGQYRVVEDTDTSGYKVVEGDGAAVYHVEELTAEAIQAERNAAQSDPVFAKLGHVTPAMVPPEYKIGSGDVVVVTVWDHPELTNPRGAVVDNATQGVLVAADGTMFYPYVGVFKVLGKTAAEVRAIITEKISGVITKPQVDVRVTSYRAHRVQVFGEVVNPGTVTLDDTYKGIIEAVSERGGLSPLASRRQVLLQREGITYSIDFSRLLSGNSAALDPPLLPGDIVQVPDKSGDQVFVLGEVDKQQPVVIQQNGMTLTEALSLAGGLDKLRSDDAGVLIFRRPSESGQMPRIFKLDMSHPQGLLLAGEFNLHPRDVVYVKATNFAKYNSLVTQLLPTISAIYQLDFIARYNP